MCKIKPSITKTQLKSHNSLKKLIPYKAAL